MVIRNDVSQSGGGSTATGSTRGESHIGPGGSWRASAPQGPTPQQLRRRRLLVLLSVILLIAIILAGVRLAAGASGTNDQLFIRIGNQQVVTLDLRQSLPINPAILGVNVFPEIGTISRDNANGYMQYSSSMAAGFRYAQIRLLRFPGGVWGEEHYPSLDQLSAFAALLQQVHADGMAQVRLSGPINGGFTELNDITNRVYIAGRWVDFLNNPRSDQRIGGFAHAPYHPIKYWSIGNEPDTLINPATGKKYTVGGYVQDFIQYSLAMHRIDPTIKVFGPEISEFYGPGAGPSDANGTLWMEGFLQGVGAYERANHVTLLDGVSFHRTLFANAAQAPYAFLSSTGEWNYLLPALRELIAQNLKRDAPIAITAINTNPANQQAPSRGLAALWWADTLGTLMDQQVDYVAFSSAAGGNTPYSLFSADGQQPTPMFRVMELFSHLQHNLIPLEVQRDPVSMYATQDDNHQTVSLLFVNKSPTTQLAQVSAGSSFFMTNPWSSLDISLMGYSTVTVTLHRNGTGSDEAYSFIAPASNDASTAQVLHTICGNKTDALANAIPC
jgi:hypothetical protein